MRSATEERAAMVPKQVDRLARLLSEGSDVTTTRIAGGAVRDLLMDGDLADPKDWDLATILRPEAVMAKAEQANLTVIPTGLQHGTVTVVVGGMPLEVTTLRADVDTDGRHAEVEFITDWKQDAQRRDLTMNALFMDVDGLVWDYVGGINDIRSRTVRFVGDAGERIQEDFLRILRFFRFAGRMSNQRFDPEALSAVRRLSPNLNKISGERVWMEMSKILTGPDVVNVLQHMDQCGVLESIGIMKTDIGATLAPNSFRSKPETVLAALVGNAGTASQLADAWKMSKAERKTLEFVANHSGLTRPHSTAEAKMLTVEFGKELTIEALSLTRAGWLRAEIVENWEIPTFPLTGADVLAQGIEAGPEVGRCLAMCKNFWMGSHYAMTKDEMIEVIRTDPK